MTNSKSFKFEFYHLFLPILGLGLSILITLIARFLLIYIVRPVMIWFEQLREYLWNSFLINITQITGIGWLDMLLAGIIIFLGAIIVLGLMAISEAIKEEQGIDLCNFDNLPYEGVVFIFLAAFTCLGWSFAPLLYVLGQEAFTILICPFVAFFCFFNTILDYHNILNGIYVDVWSDLAHEDIKNLVHLSDFIDWVKADKVIINNFFSYWFYSLRASVLGIRCSGFFFAMDCCLYY